MKFLKTIFVLFLFINPHSLLAADINIAFFASSSENGYNQATWEGVKKAANEAGNVNAEIFNGEFNATLQYGQIEDIIASGKFDGFVVVPETVDKIKEILKSGELEHLTPERKWLEIYKTSENLDAFFSFIITHGARDILFPEILNDTLEEKLLYPNDALKVEIISSHLYNWIQTPQGIESFCKRLKIPNEYKSLALLFSNCLNEYSDYVPDSTEDYDRLLSLIKRMDIRKKDRLNSFMKCIHYSNTDLEQHRIFLENLIKSINNFKLSDEDQKKPGIEIKKIIENAYKEIAQDAIRKFLNKK